MGLFGPYVYKSKKGVKWWLHMKQRGKRKLYYFTKSPIDALGSLPMGFEVIESPRTGLPMLKRKQGGLFAGLVGGGKKPQSPPKQTEEAEEKAKTEEKIE